MRFIFMTRLLLFLFVLITISWYSTAQTLYFPPVGLSEEWQSVSPASLGWNPSEIQPLYDFLQKENTKAFIVLKNGKIVIEKYFGSFTADSSWYWASAGKTITSFLVGQAQKEGFLSINDPTSKYLGTGWTSCTVEQENKITIRHQLTMTTGLDDGVADNHCTLKPCLKYLADPGNRWAYHNAPYTLLEKVLVNATKLPVNTFTQQRLKTPTGMTGAWFTIDYDNVYFSTARSMARFGLLILNRGVWNKDTLLKDKDYISAMTSTSQGLNKSYGYLWWLNGKTDYMLPTVQFVFKGSYAPDAPSDMYAALGKNGQILSISPSNGLVVVRMGNPSDSPLTEIGTLLCNNIWQKLNAIMFQKTAVTLENQNDICVYPNPSSSCITVTNFEGEALISNFQGKEVWKGTIHPPMKMDVSGFEPGLYFLKTGSVVKKFMLIK